MAHLRDQGQKFYYLDFKLLESGGSEAKNY